MFRMIIAAAAIAGAALPSQAEVLFRGVYEITKTNTACTDGPRVGDIDNAQFHPRGFGNSNFSALTIIYEFGGMSYEIDNGNFGTSYKRVVTEGQGWSTFGADKPANILVNPIPSITKFDQHADAGWQAQEPLWPEQPNRLRGQLPGRDVQGHRLGPLREQSCFANSFALRD
jgi:hypothetical protein